MSEKKPLEWSVRSRRNLTAIYDHIAPENHAAALAVLNEIRETGLKLSNFPMLGHIGRRSGTRELVLPRYPYTLVYRVYAARLVIVAVLHQSRKYA